MQSVDVDGDTFSVGDSAYVRMTNSFNAEDFADVELCQICGQAEPEDIAMLECNKCLQGYHLTCLTPPLAEVPKVFHHSNATALTLCALCMLSMVCTCLLMSDLQRICSNLCCCAQV